jgi:hypothetical protein
VTNDPADPRNEPDIVRMVPTIMRLIALFQIYCLVFFIISCLNNSPEAMDITKYRIDVSPPVLRFSTNVLEIWKISIRAIHIYSYMTPDSTL